MTAPTFVDSYYGAYAVTSAGVNVTASLTCAVGDVLVMFVSTEDSSFTAGAPSGGAGLTWSLAREITTAGYGHVYAYTCTATAANTAAGVSVAAVGSTYMLGMRILRFSGSDGIGASDQATGSGSATVGVTTTAADSKLAWVNADWSAADGTTRTWSTIDGNAYQETGYFRDAARLGAYTGYFQTGAAGAKTVTQTAPSTTFATIAVEVKGSAGSAFADGYPSGGAAVPASSSVLNASWSAYPVALGYQLEVDGVIVAANQPGVTFADTGLAPSQTRSYRVRALR